MVISSSVIIPYSALIKVALEVSIDDIILPTNFATRKIRFIPYRVKHTSATNQ